MAKLTELLESGEIFKLIFALIILWLAVIAAIRLIRFIINFLRYIYLSMRYRPRGKKYKPKKQKQFFNTDESRLRDQEKEIETKSTGLTYVDPNKSRKQLQQTSEEQEIVGIAEPIGKWTKFVTLEKLSWLRAMVGTKADSDRFWQNMIHAQQQAQSKQRSRGGPSM